MMKETTSSNTEFEEIKNIFYEKTIEREILYYN